MPWGRERSAAERPLVRELTVEFSHTGVIGDLDVSGIGGVFGMDSGGDLETAPLRYLSFTPKVPCSHLLQTARAKVRAVPTMQTRHRVLDLPLLRPAYARPCCQQPMCMSAARCTGTRGTIPGGPEC